MAPQHTHAYPDQYQPAEGRDQEEPATAEEQELDEEHAASSADGPAVLSDFVARGLITEVVSLVKSGKEAMVYCCRAHPSTGHAYLAAKVYRARDRRTFTNDAVYWEGATGSVGKRREQLAFRKKTSIGREVQAARWVGREHETLSVLHAAGADVPAPIAATNAADGALLMEFFGDERGAAPQLQHVTLTPDEAVRLYQQVLDNIALWLAHYRIHADLSAFNLLYWHGTLKVIDFPQAVDPRQNANAWRLLERDLANVQRYFARYGIESDPAWLAYDLQRQYSDPRYRR